MVLARYYKKQADGIRCLLCPHACILQEGEVGKCHTRKNIEGELYSLAYGNPCAVHIDPIEKKPLNHFLPASRSLSIATAGCNLSCLNCQNWQISQGSPDEYADTELMPAEVVNLAESRGCTSISYTYTDPTVYYEYMVDTAKLARQKGLKNVMVSAGYIQKAPLQELCNFIDAANIDLKSFSNELYQSLNGATLKPVLQTLNTLKNSDIWLEITNLVIPGYTDDKKMIKQMCQWLVDNGFENVPLHFSRFSPTYQLQDAVTTPVSILDQVYEIAKQAGINYVYIGNVPGHDAQHTYCHHCASKLIDRAGYFINENHIVDGKCEFCNTVIPGVWQ